MSDTAAWLLAALHCLDRVSAVFNALEKYGWMWTAR